MSDFYGTLTALHSSLDYHMFRHNVLASNLAHVDTPGYTPKDVARDSADFSGQLAMATTNASQIGNGAAVSEPYNVFADPSPNATGLDKNSVSLDREAAKVASNQIRYDVVSVLASSELASAAYAANDGH
jgi:flagellar basal-body rod protein FlgB